MTRPPKTKKDKGARCLLPDEDALWEAMMEDVTPLKKSQNIKGQHKKGQGEQAKNNQGAHKEQKTHTAYTLPEDIGYFDAFVDGEISLDDIPNAAPVAHNHKNAHKKEAQTEQPLPNTSKLSWQNADVKANNPAPNSSAGQKQSFIVAENSPHKLAGWRAGTNKKTMQMLAKGKPNPTVDVDLHGYTLIQAYAEIRTFLAFAKSSGHKCALIIHGKGRRDGQDMGAIKQNLAHFLAERPEVLAFHTAHAKHGGSGACYVLLKRTK